MSKATTEPLSAAELARALLADEVSDVVDVDHLHSHMEAVLGAHLRGVTGDPSRDIEDIWSERDGMLLLYAGRGEDVLRLLVSIEFDMAERSASITLRATKGRVGVDEIDWGAAGPEIGNSILVARLLHIGILVLRSKGISTLTNDPWDTRLRAHYELMGFEGGERLALDDEASLTRAFGYVERVYRRFGLRLSKL